MTDTLLPRLLTIVGPQHVLTGADAAPYGQEWTGKYHWQPRCVVRPADTAEVVAVMRLATETGTAVVPVAGRTGITGATHAEGQVMLSVERLNRIREIRPETRVAVVEAGCVLAHIHAAAAAQDLVFPLTFGARGSAMIGGALATNAGGSNVLRYGSTRGLCLGLEVVMADGQIMNLMSELHKDNAGYDLKDIIIGSEGTLGVITAAVLRLFPKPKAYATALIAMERLGPALALLHQLQAVTAGAVEAFEFMPDTYMARLRRFRPDLKVPLSGNAPVTILVEVGATTPRDATPQADGTVPVVTILQETLAALLDTGAIADAVVAQSQAQRDQMWAIREAAAEITLNQSPMVDCDIAVPLDKVETFLARMAMRLKALDPDATDVVVSHLGDGNIHYTAFPSRPEPPLLDSIRDAVDEVACDLKGSFSAEHGIGLSKLSSMARHKDPVALDMMRRLKRAFDPAGILNPGKTVP